MRFFQRYCGWYYEYTDKQGVLQTRGPFQTEAEARKQQEKS